MFIAGPDCYYEFQINALGTIYEVFYIWQEAHKKGSYFDRPEFDLQPPILHLDGHITNMVSTTPTSRNVSPSYIFQ